jgi:putative DNA primase/helicase
MLANGCGKSRAAQNGDARAAKRWQTFFLSSGEVSLADHARSDGRGRRNPAGQEVRILDIEADAGAGLGLFNTLHDAASGDSLSRAIKHGAGLHHGHAGPAFVRSLLGQQEAVAKLVRIGIEAFTRQNLPPGAGGQETRVCHRLGLLAMAGELATRNGILPWPEGEATRAAKAIFADWLAARGGIGAAEDRAAVQQVAGFLAAHGASRFQPITGEAPTIVANRAGFWRDDSQGGREFLISTKTWREEVCQGLNPSAVAQVLIREGYLRPGTGNKVRNRCPSPALANSVAMSFPAAFAATKRHKARAPDAGAFQRSSASGAVQKSNLPHDLGKSWRTPAARLGPVGIQRELMTAAAR